MSDSTHPRRPRPLDDPPASPHADVEGEIAPSTNLPSCRPGGESPRYGSIPVEVFDAVVRGVVQLQKEVVLLRRGLALAEESIRFLLALEDEDEPGVGELLDEIEGREDVPWDEKEPS